MNEINNAENKNTGSDSVIGSENTDNENTGRKGMESKNVIWGALFLIGAVALLVNKLGFLNLLLGGMSFFQIIASVFLVRILVKGMARHSFGQILFSIAFLIIVNDKVLHMEAFTPWTVLGAALLGTIGLHLMFPNVKGGYGRLLTINGKEIVPKQVNGEGRKGGKECYENCFGESVKYVLGEIKKVKLDNCFGSMQVYFTDAQLMDGVAEVKIDNVFGNTILYIPADWKVVSNVDSVFGGSSHKGQCNPAGSNVLYVKGNNCFGTVQVRYI